MVLGIFWAEEKTGKRKHVKIKIAIVFFIF